MQPKNISPHLWASLCATEGRRLSLATVPLRYKTLIERCWHDDAKLRPGFVIWMVFEEISLLYLVFCVHCCLVLMKLTTIVRRRWMSVRNTKIVLVWCRNRVCRRRSHLRRHWKSLHQWHWQITWMKHHMCLMLMLEKFAFFIKKTLHIVFIFFKKKSFYVFIVVQYNQSKHSNC